MYFKRLVFLLRKRILKLFLGVVRDNGVGLIDKAKAWEQDAPPVVTGCGADPDTECFIIAGRKTQIAIILHRKILIAESDFDRIAITCFGDSFLCLLLDLRNPGDDLAAGIPDGCCFGQIALQVFDNGITHLQLECLILGCIAVCDDMKADDPGGNTLLDRFCRFLTV